MDAETPVKIENWGLIDYPEAHRRQLDYVEEIISDKREDTVVVCRHNPVITLGKSVPEYLDTDNFYKQNKNLPKEILLYSCERGGSATYHGPGQVVCYPIINMKIRSNDVGSLLGSLEKAIINTLKHYGIVAAGNPKRGDPRYTGVWAGGKKVASIGIAIKRWIAYHGLAVNLYSDPLAFKGFNPCNHRPESMTSLAELLEKIPERNEFESILSKYIIASLPRKKLPR